MNALPIPARETEPAIDAAVLIERLARDARAAQRGWQPCRRSPGRRPLNRLRPRCAVPLRRFSKPDAVDVANGAAAGLSGAMIDRLRLDPARIEAMAAGVAEVAALDDPVGRIIDEMLARWHGAPPRAGAHRPHRDHLTESRPNVTADAAALGAALQATPCCCAAAARPSVRTGRSMRHWQKAWQQAVCPPMPCSLCRTQDRAAVGAMLAGSGFDRHDRSARRQEPGRAGAGRCSVPALAHLDGINHTFAGPCRRSGDGARCRVQRRSCGGPGSADLWRRC